MDINIGQKIIVRGDFGTGKPVEAEVIDIDEKNGRPLVIYDDGTDTRWAYFDQIVKLLNEG